MPLSSLLPQSTKDRIKRQLGVLRTDFCLERLQAAGFTPGLVLDLGAHRGDWTKDLRKVWPGAAVLMVEGDPAFLPDLRREANLLGNCEVQHGLLAERNGEEVRWLTASTASCIVPPDDPRETVTQTTTTLDHLVRGSRFAKPDLIKLDLQGAELRALAGATETLRSAAVLIVELNLLPLIAGGALIADVICHLSQRGFRLYDLGQFGRRPSDRAMWWIDGVFVREGEALLADRPYE